RAAAPRHWGVLHGAANRRRRPGPPRAPAARPRGGRPKALSMAVRSATEGRLSWTGPVARGAAVRHTSRAPGTIRRRPVGHTRRSEWQAPQVALTGGAAMGIPD